MNLAFTDGIGWTMEVDLDSGTRTLFNVWVFFLFIFTAVTGVTIDAQAKAVYIVETPRQGCLNFRAKARYRSSTRGCLPYGSTLQILDHRPGGYSRVRADGRTGYVWTPFLQSSPAPFAEVTRAEVAQDLPAPHPAPPLRVPRPAPAQRELSPPRERPRSGENVNSLLYQSARSLESGEIGRGQGFSLSRRVGWAKLDSEGDLQLQGPRRSHCTSATHAAFLKTVGELHKQGRIVLNPSARAALNSTAFRDVWNSNGYGPAKLIELLGGQNFRDPRQARAGDFVKIDRARTGHMVILSSIKNGRICYWSSNRGTNGVGERCESTAGKSFVFSRITSTDALQSGLNSLASNLRVEPAFADVRRRQGNGFVKLASLNLISATAVREPASLNIREARLYASDSATDDDGVQ